MSLVARHCLPFLLLPFLALPAFGADHPLRDQALEFFKHRQWSEAQVVLEKLTAVEPASAEAWRYLGEVHLARNEAEKSVAALEKATQLDGTKSEYFLVLGNAYGFSAQKAGLFSKLGFAKKCKAAYEKAVELDLRNVNARWSLMEYCRQAPGIAGGGMDQAYVQAEEIRKLDAGRGRVALATLYVAEKKMVEAFGLFDEALRANPDDYTALYHLGRLSAMTGQRLDEGLANLRRCLTMTVPSGQAGPAPVNWRIGNLLEKKGDKAAARTAYEAALAADPAFVPATESLRKLKEG